LKIYLKQLSENDGKDIYDMLQRIESNDNGFYNDVKDMTFENYILWLKKNSGYSQSIGLENWMVPQSTYWLYCDKTPIGCGRIRHYLNDNLKKDSGHIGYAISFPYRGKGYGNELLKLLIIECKKMKIEKIQIGVNKNNEKSNKVVLKNGGKIIEEIDKKYIYIVDTK
jgi:predicted acetyltransferase